MSEPEEPRSEKDEQLQLQTLHQVAQPGPHGASFTAIMEAQVPPK